MATSSHTVSQQTNTARQIIKETDGSVINIHATFAEMGAKVKDVVVKDTSLVTIQKHYPPVKLKTPSELKEWGNFPPRVSCFVERPKKVEELNAAFEQAGDKLVVLSAARLSAAALQGLGGIGKTQLATDYIQNEAIMSRYVFCAWFNAETEEQLEREYISLGQTAGIIMMDDKSPPAEKVKIVKRWLSHKENHGWLLVYDNVTEATSVKKYIPSKGGHILITSRKATWVDAKVIEVPLFTDEEARELIIRQSGCEAEEPALTNLIEELGHLPLALAQAGAYIKVKLGHYKTPIAEYLSLYLHNKEERLKDDTLRQETLLDTHESVHITFDMNFKELPPESLKTLYHCGLLASEPIPIDIIKESMKVGVEEAKEQEAVKYNEVFDEALFELNKYSLLAVDAKKQIVSLHRILKVLMQARFEHLSGVERGLRWFEVTTSMLTHSEERNPSMQEVKRRTDLTVHLQEVSDVFDELESAIDKEQTSEVKINKDVLQLWAANLYSELGDEYYTMGDVIRAGARWERALRIDEAHYGQDHWQVASTLVNLANAFGALGDAQTKKTLLERALAIKEEHYGKDHWQVASTLVNLANAFGALGDAQTKKTLLERALAIDESHYGKDRWQVAITLGGLANAFSALGDAQTQKTLLERALAIKEEHYGKDHWQVASTLVNLACAFGDLGDAQMQKMLLERALAIEEKHYGKDHWQAAITLVNLACAFGDLGDAQTQKTLLERALAIEEKYYGKDHWQVASTLVNLACAFGALGNAQTRKSLLERALAIQEEHYGKDHWQVAITLGGLANAFGALGDAQTKKTLLERALVIQEEHYGKDHWQVAITLGSLANAVGALGDAQTQKTLLERALAIQEEHYGKDHWQVAITLGNLACAFGALGYAQTKKTLLERALAIQEEHYGKDHWQVAITLVNLANTFGALGYAQTKKTLLERALAIQEEHYGKDHWQVASTLVNLANALGDAQTKKTLLERALAIKEEHYGKDHWQVVITLGSLANALGALGDTQTQKTLLERALAIKESHYGQEHPSVALTLGHLAMAYKALGQIELGLSKMERAHRMIKSCSGYEQHPHTLWMERCIKQLNKDMQASSKDSATKVSVAQLSGIFHKEKEESGFASPLASEETSEELEKTKEKNLADAGQKQGVIGSGLGLQG